MALGDVVSIRVDIAKRSSSFCEVKVGTCILHVYFSNLVVLATES